MKKLRVIGSENKGPDVGEKRCLAFFLFIQAVFKSNLLIEKSVHGVNAWRESRRKIFWFELARGSSYRDSTVVYMGSLVKFVRIGLVTKIVSF